MLDLSFETKLSFDVINAWCTITVLCTAINVVLLSNIVVKKDLGNGSIKIDRFYETACG